MAQVVLALDQGTTSSRSIVFRHSSRPAATAQREFPQIFPSPGHVEHDPEAIWTTQLATARAALRSASTPARDVSAIGITNQRETIVVWEKSTGDPVANAIVWQSRISSSICDRLKADGLEETFRRKTGLVLDPYFSGTKLKYLLDRHRGLRRRAARGEILAGTIDTFLLWRLTGGRVHATDPSNASRTLLFDIHRQEWDDELLTVLDVPREMLPEVRDSSGVFGETDRKLFGASVPIAGIAGDQQAATFGQACFRKGMVKNTYGTGCFMLMNIGSQAVASKNGLLTTIGWRLGGRTTYCLEGSVFVAGAAVQWLRDGLGLISTSGDVERLAGRVTDAGGIYFVPALVGLGAPHWDPYARGIVVGIERGTTAAHLARAAIARSPSTGRLTGSSVPPWHGELAPNASPAGAKQSSVPGPGSIRRCRPSSRAGFVCYGLLWSAVSLRTGEDVEQTVIAFVTRIFVERVCCLCHRRLDGPRFVERGGVVDREPIGQRIGVEAAEPFDQMEIPTQGFEAFHVRCRVCSSEIPEVPSLDHQRIPLPVTA